jgi:hypothetical protein
VVTLSIGGSLQFSGFNPYQKRDSFVADAGRFAQANPQATESMAARLGEAARRARTLSYSDFGRGQVLVHPFQPREIRIDASGSSLPQEQRDALDEIGIHLAWQSYEAAEILCNALIVDAFGEPTAAFFRLAEANHRFPLTWMSKREFRRDFWVKEVRKVHEWFAKFQREHPVETAQSTL